MKNYKRTLLACYLGFVTQAISANLVPLLFLTFQREYSLSLGNIALISTVFFLTQLVVDFICAGYVDRMGYRRCIVLSEVLSTLGLAGLAFVPGLFQNAFAGIILCVVVYAVGSGLIEVLVSPIVEACPFENKEGAMSLLHSFYCWGTLGVILLSTAFFALFGTESWRILVCLWALVPLYNIYNFATCPIEMLVEEGQSMTMGQLFKNRLFWLMVVLMVCAGASELAMAQWASAFAEAALGVSKTVGDLAGPGLFAIFMGVSRVIFARSEGKIKLRSYMVFSGLLCVVCYLLAALSGSAVLALVGCAVCGYAVGIMWPGSISISAASLPTGGTAMFALLALAGDLGGAVGPAIVGAVSQRAGDDLHVGILCGIVFPIVLVISVLCLNKEK